MDNQTENPAGVAEEIERAIRGFCQPIVLHLDPVCAYHVACGVQLALTHPKMPESGQETLVMVDKGLEERIAQECPELAALLARGRGIKERGETSPASHTLNGTELIAAERKRQIQEEGFTPESDAALHKWGELTIAAQAYAEAALRQVRLGEPFSMICNMATAREVKWRWPTRWWKPKLDPIGNLVKAGALIAAEIDRLLAARGGHAQ